MRVKRRRDGIAPLILHVVSQDQARHCIPPKLGHLEVQNDRADIGALPCSRGTKLLSPATLEHVTAPIPRFSVNASNGFCCLDKMVIGKEKGLGRLLFS